MWHFDVSEHHCHEEFTPLYTTHWDPWASSVWRRRATLKPILRCCARCASLSVTLQSSPPVLQPAARHYISSFFLSATQEMNHSNNHSTCAQMTPKHKTGRHTDFNINPPPHPTPSSFLGNVLQFQIRLSHQFLPVKGKKEGRKAMKMMISLSWSLGLSHTIYFDIPPHQLLYLTILCTEST